MTWALVVVAVWLVVAGVVALVIGRGICMADRKSTGRAHRVPGAGLTASATRPAASRSARHTSP